MQVGEQVRDSLQVVQERAGALVDLAMDDAVWLLLAGRAIRIAIVILLALVVIGVVKRVTRRWVSRVEHLPVLDPKRQRARTVSDLISSAARYIVWIMAVISILAAVGLDIAPLLAGAGVAGLAIGFGAQTLVKDVISGIFLLFDESIHVGDLITFNGQAGTVEYIGLRLIKARKFDGEVLMIPAGELRTFGNKSMGFARAIVEVGLAYEQDVDEALPVLRAVAEEWAAIPENRAKMLQETPEVQALMTFGDSSVNARIVVQMVPGEQFAAERDLRRRLKKRFDEAGIEIPFPRRTVYVRNRNGDGNANGADPAPAAAPLA